MNHIEDKAFQFFAQRGGFCRTGDGTSFTLEVFHWNPEALEMLLCWGGHIYEPRPSHPNEWYWRLYGKAARRLWKRLRMKVSEEKRIRGDAKLLTCERPFERKKRKGVEKCIEYVKPLK